MTIQVSTQPSQLTDVESRFRRRMAVLWNTSEHLLVARCAVTDWGSKADSLPPEAIAQAADFFGFNLTSIEQLGASQCVTDASPPPQSPFLPPAPPAEPPAPPANPPIPPTLPPFSYAVRPGDCVEGPGVTCYTGGPGGGAAFAPPAPPPEACQPGTRGLTDGKYPPCELCGYGVYCSGGELSPCPRDTYGDSMGAGEVGACKACPPHSSSEEGSVSKQACVCDVDYFYSNATLDCERCPIGANCSAVGITLDRLPLYPGYWRFHPEVKEVFRCPGSAFGESSGCAGSADGDFSYCKPTLTGPFCSVCDDEYLDMLNGTGVDPNGAYYLDSSAHACLPCGERATSSFQFIAWGMLGIALALAMSSYLVRCLHLLETDWAQRMASRYHRMQSRFERISRGGGGIQQLREGLNFVQVGTQPHHSPTPAPAYPCT